jgi:hypothetical protein
MSNAAQAKCMLCVFSESNLMVTQDEDVLHGIANGTVCKFHKLVPFPGEELEKSRIYNYWVHIIAMDGVEYLAVEWQDCDHFVVKF